MADLVKSFLEGMSGSEQEYDEHCIAFLAAALAEEDAELHELDEQLAELFTSYGKLPLEVRMTDLVDLYHKVLAEQAAVQPSWERQHGSALTTKSAPLPTAELACKHGSAGSGPGPGSEAAVAEAAHNDPLVDQLQALCPTLLSRAFVAHVLRTNFGGDVQAAANFLLECDNLAELEGQYSRQAEALLVKQREEQQLQERSKKEVIARFALQEVKTQPLNNRKPGPALDPLQAAGPQAEAPKVRYLNGIAVNVRKGEKYVFESTKEDWDGGSKGKVHTKGKRGKGFA